MLLLVASALSRWRLNHAIAYMRRPIEIAKFFDNLFDIEEEVEELQRKKLLEDFPLTSGSLADISEVLEKLNGNLNIENIEIVQYSNHKGEIQYSLLKQEVENLPDEVKKVFERRYVCFMRLLFLKHSRTSYIVCGRDVTKFDIWFTYIKLSVLVTAYMIASVISKSTQILTKKQYFDSSKLFLAEERKIAEIFS